VIEQVRRFIIPAAFDLLPPWMSGRPAAAMLLAIGLQESRFEHRQQIVGPARGFWQFEQGGGVAGVLSHPLSAGHARKALRDLRYPDSMNAATCHMALAHNDVLAAIFARLLLVTLPVRLPLRDESNQAWRQYFDAWRPGKPHPATWTGFYNQAWHLVETT
jgi:hypothetical protein